ncbi:hypothetical protein GCM10008026_27380 [Chelatococcus composti]|nr:hypothetical protein GCM10008026_27380 [Chelatococcus composti]
MGVPSGAPHAVVMMVMVVSVGPAVAGLGTAGTEGRGAEPGEESEGQQAGLMADTGEATLHRGLGHGFGLLKASRSFPLRAPRGERGTIMAGTARRRCAAQHTRRGWN